MKKMLRGFGALKTLLEISALASEVVLAVWVLSGHSN